MKGLTQFEPKVHPYDIGANHGSNVKLCFRFPKPFQQQPATTTTHVLKSKKVGGPEPNRDKVCHE